MKEVLDQPEFADIRPAAREAVDYVTDFRMKHEPAMRAIKTISNTVNDPFRLFGIGVGDRALGSVFDAHTTEGVIRGAGTLDAHVELQNMLSEVPGDFRRNYERGLGVHTANFARTYFRNGMVKDLRRKARNGDTDIIPFEKEPGVPLAPSEVIEAKMGGARGIDIATGVEQYALRVRPLYLATEKGGAEAALTRARQQAAQRLQLMGMDEASAVKLSGRMSRDHASLLDASYFGFATEGFTKARAKAMTRPVKKGGLDPEALTILGPRQMTVQVAEDILAAIARGDTDTVRAAMNTYDILFDNLSHQMDEDKLIAQVKMLLTDQIEGKALPRDLDSLDGLEKGLRQWAEDNAELGYRPGHRPTPENGDHWRVTVDRTGDTPKIIGINPWVELVGTTADVPTYNRWQRARSMLFHDIRGERIMADARVRMAEFVTEEWGGTKADADALFARFISAATEAGVTPRAMSPKQIYSIVGTQKMTVPVNKVGMNNAVEVLMYAFEGNWRHVGLSQKFTGAAKTTMGGQSNWIGQMAERVYPLTRFTLNPLFQVQELVEPFVMNTARGIKPGFKPSDMDTKTIALVESMIRDGIYSFDDQIERTAVLLWGANAAKEAYKPAGPLGKLVHLMSLNGRINVQSVKQVNYARATRRQLGKEFESAMARVAPDLHVKLPRHYGTSDWGEVAVRYLTEKGQLETPMHVLKPDYLGQRAPVELDKVIAHFDDIETSAELRAAVTRGDLTRTDFHDTLVAAGADPDFVIRAYDTAAAGFSADEWFEGWRTNFAGGNQRQTNEAKAMVKNLAQVQGMSSEEWLTKYMSGVPQSVDESALAALTPAEKRHVKLMTDLAAMDQGISAELDDALAEFRRDKRFADREHFAAIADDGTVLYRGHQTTPWHIASSGMPSEAGLGDEIADGLPLVEGNWMVHNHPSYSPFSPADIVTGVEFNAKGSIVESPGITYALTPDPDEGWLTEAFIREHGERPQSMHPKVQEAYFRGIRQRVHEEWISKGQEVIANLQQHPFYADATGEQWDGYLEAIGGQVAVKRLADRYGWTFKSTEHALLPADAAVRHELVRDFLQNPPPGLRSRNPLAFSSQPGLRLDAKAGAAMPLSITQRNRPWLPEELANDPTVRAGWENWARARLAPKFGTAITDVAHGADNTMWDVWGTGEQIEDLSAAVGFLLRQDEVVSTKVKPGAVIARPANGERWSLNFVRRGMPPMRWPRTRRQAIGAAGCCPLGPSECGQNG